MTIAWIVGSGGLLGSALCRALRRDETELFSPSDRFHWGSEAHLAIQLATAVQAFAARVGAGRWEIYWAAGAGNMSSSESELALETKALSKLLHLVESETRLMATAGALAFASSAGGIYAGSTEYIISENSSPAPTTAYAHEKLRQEDLVRSFARDNSQVSVFLARISTIYGPGQSAGKQQGLIAHIARSMLRNRLVHIYVPLDTIGDYILSDDVAADMVATLRMTTGKSHVCMGLVASERPTTIAEIISIFKRIERRAPRVVTSASIRNRIYPRRTRFQSMSITRFARPPRMSLVVGIAQLMAAERAAFVRGPGATTK